MKRRIRVRLGPALEKLAVPRGSVAIGWLGQAGFVLKSPRGFRLAIDPYLSNSCEAVGRAAGLNMRRLVPSSLSPRAMLADSCASITGEDGHPTWLHSPSS